MANDNNFDLVLAFPCETAKGKRGKIDITELASSSLEDLGDSSLNIQGSELVIKNAVYDNKSTMEIYATTFCEQIKEHSDYELVYNDDNSDIKIDRKVLFYGNVILYEDEKVTEFTPRCCYNFFCVLSELNIGKDSVSTNDSFSIVYFVVPDIGYYDLTLLMDQAHWLWCNVKAKSPWDFTKNDGDPPFLTDYLTHIGHKYFGKIYHIIFSDIIQYKNITDGESSLKKLFNILATEAYKDETKYSHQLVLSEDTNEYILSMQGSDRENRFGLTKKEKFFHDYNMYSSYKAFASLYSYYYVINEEDKDIFSKRIMPDKDNEGFSCEANILFVLETEIFKITACLVLSKKINDQIYNNHNLQEIQKMFESFINTRPLFEKLNYHYLGAQKEADFIYEQFSIGNIMSDYDKKRELLKSYSEVSSSIIVNKNSKRLQFIGMLFTYISGFSILVSISGMLFNKQMHLIWSAEYILPILVLMIIVVNFLPFKKAFKKNKSKKNTK